MWALFFTASALAAPAGEPFAQPELGTRTVRVLGDTEDTVVLDTDCGDLAPCEGTWSTTQFGMEMQWTLKPGIGAAAGMGYIEGQIKEANFRGKGPSLFLGVNGAIPLQHSFWLTGQARVSGSAIWGATVEDGTREFSRDVQGTLTSLIAWSRLEEGPSFWAGAQSTLLWIQQLAPLGVNHDMALPLRWRYPVSGVLGISYRSQPLGLPWERSPRLTVGAEGRVGQSKGVGTWLSLAW